MSLSETAIGAGAAVVAIDVGGTELKHAVFDAAGCASAIARVPMPPSLEDAGGWVIDRAAEVLDSTREARPDLSIRALGLVVPGDVDVSAGVGVSAGNLGWRSYPFVDAGEARLGVPIGFEHDVAAAAIAEVRHGAARSASRPLVVTIGTGIAVVCFSDGALLLGGGRTGELGHTRVADGPRCVCGAQGCLEAVASAAAIARNYGARTGTAVEGSREVLARAEAGDIEAIAVWDTAVDGLGDGLAHAVALLAPDRIVVGGGLAGAGDALLCPLAHRLSSRLSPIFRRPQLRSARFGGDAGLVGAALAARARLVSGALR